MQFTVLSHAGLLVEHEGTSLLFDPWLVGSCYWRSWWNFPEPPADVLEGLAPRYVYLTHLHWDHFHGPSLKRVVGPDTTILVPRTPNRRMVADLRWLGFAKIVEIDHGGRCVLGPDFELHAYQFGLNDDSAAVVRAGSQVLFNANDCKLFGSTLGWIRKRHPRIDFVFKSHSSASAVPYCIEGHEALFPGMRDPGFYIDAFANFAIDVGARYAVPFASSHCFLHPQTRRFNALSVSPSEVQLQFAPQAALRHSAAQCVVMPPGSSWSEKDGFDCVAFDYAQAPAAIAAMADKYADRLQAQARVEADTTADPQAFDAYFDAFLAALPPFASRLIRRDIAFRIRGADGSIAYWRLDFARRRIERGADPTPGAIVIETPAAILNDCTRIRMFSTWTPSKRLSFELAKAGDLGDLLRFLTALDLFELDALPVRNLFSARSLGTRARRWREYVDYARLVIGRRNPWVSAGQPAKPPAGGIQPPGIPAGNARLRPAPAKRQAPTRR